VEGREPRAAAAALVVAVQQQHNAVPSGADLCPALALIRPHHWAKDVFLAVMSDDDIRPVMGPKGKVVEKER